MAVHKQASCDLCNCTTDMGNYLPEGWYKLARKSGVKYVNVVYICETCGDALETFLTDNANLTAEQATALRIKTQ